MGYKYVLHVYDRYIDDEYILDTITAESFPVLMTKFDRKYSRLNVDLVDILYRPSLNGGAVYQFAVREKSK